MPYAKSRGRGAAAASTPTANQTKRDSRLYLTVKPVNISLTDGTNIPPPPPSPPPVAPAAAAENHTNSLTPHLPGSFPADNPTHARKTSIASTTDSNAPALTSSDLPPQEENPPRPSTAIRRMFSLNNLRQSFSSSRTSLALPRTSNDPSTGRPKSPSVASTMASAQPAEGERPGTATKKRRGSWFGSSSRRRSSGFWNSGAGETGSSAGLESVMEEEGTAGGAGGGVRGNANGNGNKRVRDSRFAAPRLPDVGTLRGGRLDGGDLGWDEGMFRKKE